MPLIEDAEFDPEMAAESPAPQVETDEPKFDPRHRDDFSGLLWLGALSKRFEWCGHSFTIRTLRTEEILAVGLAVKAYEGAPSQMRAYATAVVSACLTRVDDKPFETPYREQNYAENLEYRMQKVGAWAPPSIDAIYSQYIELEERAHTILEEMGKASG